MDLQTQETNNTPATDTSSNPAPNLPAKDLLALLAKDFEEEAAETGENYDFDSNTISTEESNTTVEEPPAEEQPVEEDVLPTDKGVHTKLSRLQNKLQHTEAQALQFKQNLEASTKAHSELKAKYEDIISSPFKALEACGTDWLKFIRDINTDAIQPPSPKAKGAELSPELQEIVNEHKALKKEKEEQAKNSQFQAQRKEDEGSVKSYLQSNPTDYPALASLENGEQAVINHYYYLRNDKAFSHVSDKDLIHDVFQRIETNLTKQTMSLLKNKSTLENIVLQNPEVRDILIQALGINSPKDIKQPVNLPNKPSQGNKVTTLTNSVSSQSPAHTPRVQLTAKELAAELNKGV